MKSHTSPEVKGWSIDLVTAIVDGESQLSKEVAPTNYVLLTDCLERFTSRLFLLLFK